MSIQECYLDDTGAMRWRDLYENQVLALYEQRPGFRYAVIWDGHSCQRVNLSKRYHPYCYSPASERHVADAPNPSRRKAATWLFHWAATAHPDLSLSFLFLGITFNMNPKTGWQVRGVWFNYNRQCVSALCQSDGLYTKVWNFTPKVRKRIHWHSYDPFDAVSYGKWARKSRLWSLPFGYGQLISPYIAPATPPTGPIPERILGKEDGSCCPKHRAKPWLRGLSQCSSALGARDPFYSRPLWEPYRSKQQ